MIDVPETTGVGTTGRRIGLHRRHPLAFRMLIYTLICSALLTIAGTILELFWEYRAGLREIRQTLHQIEETHLDGFVEDRRLADSSLIRVRLEALMQLPHVRRVELTGENGERFVLSDDDDGDGVSKAFSLIRRSGDAEVVVGILRVDTTQSEIRRRLLERAGVVFLIQAALTLSVSFLILAIFQWTVIRHLHTVGEYARRLNLDDLGSALKLDRFDTKRPHDELDHVVAAIQEMHRRLEDDVSALRCAERERRLLIADLEAKNTELENFTSTVAHDLKAPLVTIRGFLGFIEKDLAADDPGRIRRDMRRIVSATNKMHALLEDLLELSQVGRLVREELEDLSLSETAQEVEELLAGQLAESRVSFRIDPALPRVRGDHARLRQVLQNLVSNACKFMGDQEAPSIAIETLPPIDGLVGFTVRDNGIGIDREHQEGVFRIFQRIHHDIEGSGIGLALVHRIVSVHSGRVWVESKGSGYGSAFHVLLPPAGRRDA